jgi:hypothetical protein
VGGARLTCGQPTGQASFFQVSPKREDLTQVKGRFTVRGPAFLIFRQQQTAATVM